MMLHPSYVAAGSATRTLYNTAPSSTSPTSGLPGSGHENWSSFIGITTAIVGNIMISFALNMQRYAHIRLSREWDEKERRRKKRRSGTGTSASESASPSSVERRDANLAGKYHRPRETGYDNGIHEREDTEDEYEAEETDGLLPRARRSRDSGNGSSRSLESEANGEEEFKQKSYLKSPYWWIGIILMVTGEAGNFLAYGFAPASIVSPLGVVALISNCIIAPFLLKERFRKRDGFGVLISVAGAVTVVLSASDHNPKLGPEEIWDLISRWEFETYLGITVVVIGGLMVASNRFGEKSILIDLGLVGLFGRFF